MINDIVLVICVVMLVIVLLYLLHRNGKVGDLSIKLIESIPCGDSFYDKLKIHNKHSYESMLFSLTPLSKIEQRIMAEMKECDKKKVVG